MVIIDQESYHCQQRKICIYYLDAGHPLDRALLLLLRRPLPALNLHYNHDGDDEDDDDDHSQSRHSGPLGPISLQWQKCQLTLLFSRQPDSNRELRNQAPR